MLWEGCRKCGFRPEDAAWICYWKNSRKVRVEGRIVWNQVSFYCTKVGMFMSDAGIHMTFILDSMPTYTQSTGIKIYMFRIMRPNESHWKRTWYRHLNHHICELNKLHFLYKLSCLSISPQVTPNGLICLYSVLSKSQPLIASRGFTCVLITVPENTNCTLPPFYTWESNTESLSNDS